MTATAPTALMLILLSAAAWAQPSGPAQVIDGRTLVIGDEEVRLYGIDAPVLGQTCRGPKDRPYDCGDIARTALMDLTLAAEVECQPQGRDPDGRLVARCLVGGFDLGLNMVHTGWALADRRVTSRYAAIEDKAKAARRGLWRGTFETPWEWRRRGQD